MYYSFHELLILFWLTLVDIFYLKFDFLLHQRNAVPKYIIQTKQMMKWKQRYTFSSVSTLMLKNLRFLKCTIKKFLIFLSFINTFTAIPYALRCRRGFVITFYFFLLNTVFWRNIVFVYISLCCTFLALPNNSVRIYSIKLKIVMLYHTKTVI